MPRPAQTLRLLQPLESPPSAEVEVASGRWREPPEVELAAAVVDVDPEPARPGAGDGAPSRALRPLGLLDVPVRLRCFPFRARSRRRRRALPGPDASRRSRRRPRPRRRLRRLRRRRAQLTLQRHPCRARSRSKRRPLAARRGGSIRAFGVRGRGAYFALLGLAAVMTLLDDGSTVSLIAPGGGFPHRARRRRGGRRGPDERVERSRRHDARRPFRGEACHAVREGDDTVREAPAAGREEGRDPRSREERRRRRPPRPNRGGLPGRPSTAPPAITWSSSVARIGSSLERRCARLSSSVRAGDTRAGSCG